MKLSKEENESKICRKNKQKQTHKNKYNDFDIQQEPNIVAVTMHVHRQTDRYSEGFDL